MPKARREMTVYHQGEAPTIAWDKIVLGQISMSRSWSSSYWFDFLDSYAIHAAAGILAAFMIAVILPCLCQCLSCCRGLQAPEQQSYFKVSKLES